MMPSYATHSKYILLVMDGHPRLVRGRLRTDSEVAFYLISKLELAQGRLSEAYHYLNGHSKRLLNLNGTPGNNPQRHKYNCNKVAAVAELLSTLLLFTRHRFTERITYFNRNDWNHSLLKPKIPRQPIL